MISKFAAEVDSGRLLIQECVTSLGVVNTEFSRNLTNTKCDSLTRKYHEWVWPHVTFVGWWWCFESFHDFLCNMRTLELNTQRPKVVITHSHMPTQCVYCLINECLWPSVVVWQQQDEHVFRRKNIFCGSEHTVLTIFSFSCLWIWYLSYYDNVDMHLHYYYFTVIYLSIFEKLS